MLSARSQEEANAFFGTIGPARVRAARDKIEKMVNDPKFRRQSQEVLKYNGSSLANYSDQELKDLCIRSIGYMNNYLATA